MSEKNPFLYGLLKSSKEVFKLTKQRTSIGRNKNSQIVINHNTVSKDHAIIEFDEDYNATIKDLNSSNGTYVNGGKLKTIPLKLRTGDKIIFGKCDIEYIFESSNVLNDTKTEPELMNELNQNSNFVCTSNQMYDSIEMNQNTKTIKDGKISLVNENELSYPKINHFQNKKHSINDFHNSNGMNFNTARNLNSQYLNNNFYNNKKPIFIEDNNIKNNNINNNYINNNDNEEMDYYNPNNNINSSNNNNINNNNKNNLNNNSNNFLMNSDYTFKNKMDEFEKKIENLEKEKEEINKDLNNKINELKQMTNLFDELNEEYSKLNSKHNALMVYASDIQKKLDLSDLELNEYKNKKYLYNEQEINNILNQKDSMILLLQNEINFYKELASKNKTNQQTLYNNNNNDNDSYFKNIQINNKLNTISDIFINENKKLKKKLEIYKNKINNIQKNTNNTINKNNNGINFVEFETQINYQIDNFNNIISDYNSKLSDALNKITELFENNNKEEAAKYLVEQMNEYMLENQKLMAENAKLNTQVLEYQTLLNKEHENILINNKKNKNSNSDFDIENNNNINASSNNYSEINLLKNKIGELENTIENIKQFNNKTIPKNNNNDNLREAFVNVLNELKTKENIVQDLQNKLKDTIKRNNMNFDDNQIVNSISQKLKEKDNTIQSLKYKIKSEETNENEESINKIEEIRRKRQLFN